ncbi:adenylate/guanylate cyclase domain-containing protein [Leptospira stimsonii]|uniref:Adenylate/guanylate cyclase domain-containing protein n=1 Tax=Leptospira stimsonii TaxID=2202203 RepID=A0ABY2MUD0_9LEPT|nr:adenylate/guanylate cyclase domain-containing protein [Leptospira stimsonii]TGK23646.1 adenylate/guanylate cyclase domain-containing protein [Leptospira stimsonii]TGM08060.1 adenylate/guanylate cyclase domain-containing protein [Leptospira stimsonii]
MNFVNLFRSFKNALNILDRKSMPESVLEVLKKEELNGIIITNYFRYLIAFFFAIQVIANLDAGSKTTNLIAFSVYLFLTITHTIVIRAFPDSIISIFNYITLFAEYILILLILLFYTFTVPNVDYGFTLKNPINLFYLFPIIYSLLQFRIRFVFIGLFLFYLFYFSILWLAVSSGKLTYAQHWGEYVSGPAVLLEDIITGKPTLYFSFSIVIAMGIFRTVSMVRRIGIAEGQKTELSRYFSPKIVHEMMENPKTLQSGNRQTVSILFLDIRNFTSMSENMDPKELSELLSEFRNIMMECVFENNGTLDKYIGDAVMATFGTPHPSPSAEVDARNAVGCGVIMQKRLSEWNFQRKSEGKTPIAIGIGIHTGEVFAGNIGNDLHREYTVIGDAVNTASRIESLCKLLKKSFLISKETMELLGGKYTLNRMPRVKVKGKEEPIQVYEVMWG